MKVCFFLFLFLFVNVSFAIGAQYIKCEVSSNESVLIELYGKKIQHKIGYSSPVKVQDVTDSSHFKESRGETIMQVSGYLPYETLSGGVDVAFHEYRVIRDYPSGLERITLDILNPGEDDYVVAGNIICN